VLNSSESPPIGAWSPRGASLPPVIPRRIVPAAPESARYLLEDSHGAPIECPICGAIDRWRTEVMPRGQQRRGFVCRHLKEVSAVCLGAEADGAGPVGRAARSLPLGMLGARAPWTTWRLIDPSLARTGHRSIS
jgi:hypothetical protein